LAQNCKDFLIFLVNAIVELLKERKDLLLLKIKRMYEENADRVEAISRGRIPDIKVEQFHNSRTKPRLFETK
jgi:hypothetical protein